MYIFFNKLEKVDQIDNIETADQFGLRVGIQVRSALVYLKDYGYLEIDSIPHKIVYTILSDQCMICHENITDPAITKYNSIYCNNCITVWLQISQIDPRMNLPCKIEDVRPHPDAKLTFVKDPDGDKIKFRRFLELQGVNDTILDYFYPKPDYFAIACVDDLEYNNMTAHESAIKEIPELKELFESNRFELFDHMNSLFAQHPAVQSRGHSGFTMCWTTSQMIYIYKNGIQEWVRKKLQNRQ